MAIVIFGASPAAPPWSLLYAIGALAALWWAWRALERVWIRPLRLGRALRAQGLGGTAYRFPSGDMKEYVRLAMAARSQSMPLRSHAIAPRAVPFDHSILRQHGQVAVTWLGSEPRVILSDPKLIREILANKHGQFGKQRSTAWIERMLANGLTAHQGKKWVVHRRIINHAFHLEKLEVSSKSATCCIMNFSIRYYPILACFETFDDGAGFYCMLQ
ncbi:hypothetical protein QOZ80_1BG0075980 [Eleusine coracana subsp. coracana]|nr:hypothetical protein QOZ80_1BG0075980 [Eleusine coracana subsp. coracana]